MRFWQRFLLITTVALGLGLFSAPPVAAQPASTWEIDYYDNSFLTGSSEASQTVNYISFDWGTGTPADNIDDDNFSLRATTRYNFPAGGTYRFFARADDRVRVSVDFRTVIDTFNSNTTGELVATDFVVGPGVRQIQVDYAEFSEEAFLFVTWMNAAGNPTTPNFGPVQGPVADGDDDDDDDGDSENVSISGWTAQYYNNDDFSGDPAAILSTNDIDFDWGTGSPTASVNDNNFTARFTTTATLSEGTYRITTTADDGVRVLIDGETELDAFSGNVGETVTEDVTLNDGDDTYNITVEYREVSDEAFVEVDFDRLGGNNDDDDDDDNNDNDDNDNDDNVSIGDPRETGAQGTVSTDRLNVRQSPTTTSGVVTKIDRGETYPIIGRNADTSWWQISVAGTDGWVYASFISAFNTGDVPITDSSTSNPGSGIGIFARATTNVNLRSRPTRAGAILGLLPRGAEGEIIGRNIDGTWIKLIYSNRVAWVSNAYVTTGAPTSELPIVN